jgi:hypothetical protein
MAQTGQSEAIHSPEECASTVVRFTVDDFGAVVDRRCLHHCDPVLKGLGTMSSSLDSGA